MKKYACLLGVAFLLSACGTKYENVPIDYLNEKHAEIAKNILGEALNDDKKQEQFDQDVIGVYYNELSDGAFAIQVWNDSEYYYSGEVSFPECSKSVNVEAVPPHSGITTTMVCPEFDKDTDFEYAGNLYQRKSDKQLAYTYESYYYEDYPDTYDYVLAVDEMDETMTKQFAEYIYEEYVLQNVKNASTIYLFTTDSYELETFEEACKGILWIDQVNDFVEISDCNGNLIERINYR